MIFSRVHYKHLTYSFLNSSNVVISALTIMITEGRWFEFWLKSAKQVLRLKNHSLNLVIGYNVG